MKTYRVRFFDICSFEGELVYETKASSKDEAYEGASECLQQLNDADCCFEVKEVK